MSLFLEAFSLSFLFQQMSQSQGAFENFQIAPHFALKCIFFSNQAFLSESRQSTVNDEHK